MRKETEKHHITFTSGYCEPVDFDQWLGKQRKKPNDIDRIVSAFRSVLETNYVDATKEDGGSLGLEGIVVENDGDLTDINIKIRDYDYDDEETEEEDSE